MNLIPETWPRQAGPRRAVNQQPHQQQHGSDIAKHSLMVLSIPSCPAYASQWIRPETCIYHYCALILPLEYLFPFAASLSILSSQERMWNRFPFRRERKTGFFSQGVELEDGTFTNQRWVLRSDRVVMKGNHVQSVENQREITPPIVTDFEGNLWLEIVLLTWWLLWSYIWQKIYENCLQRCLVKSQPAISITDR